MTSTRRGKKLTDQRLAEGWVRLHDWITPEAAQALEALAKDWQGSRGALLSSILVRAERDR